MAFKKITFLLFLLSSTIIYPCDCDVKNTINPSIKIQKAARESSECILVGKITNINLKEQTFTITVIESLDGADVQENSYKGKGWKTCFPYFEKESIWLFYGYTENGYLRPYICGISRSFDQFSINSSNSNNQSNSISENSLYRDIEKDYLNALHLEIIALREYKRKKSKV